MFGQIPDMGGVDIIILGGGQLHPVPVKGHDVLLPVLDDVTPGDRDGARCELGPEPAPVVQVSPDGVEACLVPGEAVHKHLKVLVLTPESGQVGRVTERVVCRGPGIRRN